MRILIVDDSEDSRHLLCGLLVSAGYQELVVAASGLDALHRVCNPLVPREADIDLVLLDVNLGDMTGIDLCRRLKRETPLQEAPVIMITATDDPHTLADAFEAGAGDYMTKPVRRIELLARVRSALALKRETDARKAREQDLLRKNLELQQAIQEIHVLRGLIKICSYCKKVQNDQGSWQQVELYIREHSEAEFSHGICIECARDRFPDLLSGGAGTERGTA